MIDYNLNDIAPYFSLCVGFCGLYAVSQAIYYSTKIKDNIVKPKRKETPYNNKDHIEDRLK